MFESAELGHRLSKAEYETIEPKLRTDLLDVQLDLFEHKDFAVVILINGIDGAGRGETVNLLNEWMDPRHIEVHAFDRPTGEEGERPPMWRFWRALPPKGKIGVLFGNWYVDPIGERAGGRLKKAPLDQRLSELNRFEAMLAAEGVLLVKFWFHLSRAGQKKRLKALESSPATRWRVTALPSSPLPVPGIGRARWLLELIRCRGGACAALEVEACDAAGRLALPAGLAHGSAPAQAGQRRATA